MRWGKKQQQQESEQKPKQQLSSSPFLPFSWLSKLKKMATKKRSCVPDQKPPPPRSPPAPSRPFVPRRLSVGEDDTLLARERAAQHSRSILRSARHHSIGSELDWHRLPLSFHLSPHQSDDTPRRSRPIAVKKKKKKRRNRNNMPKVRVYSPRTSTAMTRKSRVPAARGEGLESFAVVKCSCDPQRDFRESMEEMICEKGMRRPEELEKLLACYLSLNSDEHHDVIIKVFRQVWFALNPGQFAAAAAATAASGGWSR